MDFQDQLTALRQKMAHINRKYADLPPRPAPPASPYLSDMRPARYFIEELMSGQIVGNAAGRHFQTEKLYARHRRHGSMDISNLIELPHDILDVLSSGAIPCSAPSRWAFLDTETTGLAGGAGTYAFLIGVGSIDEEGFRVRQFFMRDFAEEPSLLSALSGYLARFDVLITYNGKTYDQPLLETRYRMSRSHHPFERLTHLDLLHGARRLWKLRLDSCRLVDLENQILGLEREGDLPGEMIPYYYFEYLRTQQAFRLVPIFHHNAMDIVSLACLTAIVPFAFRSPDEESVRPGAKGPDLVGLARWLARTERHEQALRLFRRAVDLGLPDHLLFKTLWDIGRLERKMDRPTAALAVYTELAAGKNPYQASAFEELAKYYEHHERNYGMALEMTRSVLAIEDSDRTRRREDRLKLKFSKPRSKRLRLCLREGLQ